MAEEPESLILRILREMRADIGDLREKSVTKADFATLETKLAEVRSNVNSLRADVASDLLTTRKELSEQIVGLRRAVVDYHTSVLGHGMPISGLNARLPRVKQHLNLPR